MEKIGDVIKQYRNNNNLSLREFGQKCGISHSYIDKLEKGFDPRNGKKIEPTIETLKKIAAAMGISLEKFLLDTGNIKNSYELVELEAAVDFIIPLINFLKKHPDILEKRAQYFEIDTESYIAQIYNYGYDDVIEEINQLEKYGAQYKYVEGRIFIGLKESTLTKKDERDIEKILERTKKQLLENDGLMFDGNPATPEAIQSILDAMKVGLEIGKQRNKEKYTPKKYK